MKDELVWSSKESEICVESKLMEQVNRVNLRFKCLLVPNTSLIALVEVI